MAGERPEDEPQSPRAPIPTESLTYNQHKLADIQGALEAISPDCEYQVWFEVGAALHDEFDGHMAALAMYDAWSSQSQKYPGRAVIVRKWRSFGRRKARNPIGIKTLFHHASETGYRGIPYSPERDMGTDGKLRLQAHEFVAGLPGGGLRGTVRPGGKLDVEKGSTKDLAPETRTLIWGWLSITDNPKLRAIYESILGPDELSIYHDWRRHARKDEELRKLDIFELHDYAEKRAYIVPSPNPIDRLWPTRAADWFSTEPEELHPLLTRPDSAPYAIRGTSGLLSAPGGTGKSTAALQLAVAVLTGRPWLGIYDVHPSVAMGSRVAYIAAEHTGGLAHRAILGIAEDLSLDDSERAAIEEALVVLPLLGENFHVLEHGQAGNVVSTQAFETLEDRLHQHAGDDGFALIVFDTIARTAGVEVEISNDLATRYIEALESLRHVPGDPFVLGLHHTSKLDEISGQAKPRGATALKDSPRHGMTMLKLDGGRVRLENSKNNLCREDEPRVLVRLTNGTLRSEQEHERKQREEELQDMDVQRELLKQATRDRRADAALDEKADRVVELVTQRPGIQKSQLRELVGGKTAAATRAIDRALAQKRIQDEKGPRGAKLLFPIAHLGESGETV